MYMLRHHDDKFLPEKRHGRSSKVLVPFNAIGRSTGGMRFCHEILVNSEMNLLPKKVLNDRKSYIYHSNLLAYSHFIIIMP